LQKSLPDQSIRARLDVRILLTAPVIFLILAATAIPIELRPIGDENLDLAIDDIPDIVANIIGYLPLGIVLGRFGLQRAVLIALLISTLAETSQLVMAHRDPSFTDVVSNILGATMGALVSIRWKISSPAFRVTKLRGALALFLAISLLTLWAGRRGDPVNTRGDASQGILEASWKLDETGGRTVFDSSGNELVGKFSKEPKRIAGLISNTAVFDGRSYIDFGHSTGLRIPRSMTISAWINSTSYPSDDAAIVSNLHDNSGYQLDTTIDRGPRTIGFKLTNACGKLMARYGSTPLILNTWYYIAGVYDAESKTLNVYLNGELDNGYLLGSVSSFQRSSRGSVYVARRGDSLNFNFSGLIDDLHIYSFALTKSQIVGDMRGEFIHDAPVPRAASRSSCAPVSDPEDKEIPVISALSGTLLAVACMGFFPSFGRLLVLGIGFAPGFLLLMLSAPNLPAFNNWLVPAVSLAGAASIALFVQSKKIEP
jgi:VanZ family protein